MRMNGQKMLISEGAGVRAVPAELAKPA